MLQMFIMQVAQKSLLAEPVVMAPLLQHWPMANVTSQQPEFPTNPFSGDVEKSTVVS
jgi:hypothetical protein